MAAARELCAVLAAELDVPLDAIELLLGDQRSEV